MSETKPVAPKPTHWRRGIRPLIWWIFMVLIMFAYRTHERLSANTSINFEPMLAGKRVADEAAVAIDGNYASAGQQISIGWHTLTVSHPKTKTFSTNLFIWYGPHDLGEIPLERAMGVLLVAASPTAQRLTVRGPEFSVTLTNTSGITSSVPTDRYVLEATYKYWNRRDEVTVFANQSSTHSFVPRFGVLRIDASHPDVTYQLRDNKRTLLDSGKPPATINELPEGNYELSSRRKSNQQEMAVAVKGGATNEVTVEFIYGAVTISSDPPGATIMQEGIAIGTTPMALHEVIVGELEFSLRLNDYEEVNSKVMVVVTQTNAFHTNLISRQYTRAMERARRFFADREYTSAANAAQEALKYKSPDESASQLEREATGLAHLSQGEFLGQRGDYVEAIKEINRALPLLSNTAQAQAILADFTNREQERIELEQRRQAELKAQVDKRNLEQAIATLRQVRLDLLKDTFNQWCQKLPNHMVYSEHELTTTNTIKFIATSINNMLGSELPKFEILKYEWPNDNTSVSVGSQGVAGGTRMCVIVASEVQTNETRIRFKVFEYDNPPEIKLLGGLLRVSAQITSTAPPSPAELNARAEKFATRVKEGIKMVRDRIRLASGFPAATN